jgi:hypothetical protein
MKPWDRVIGNTVSKGGYLAPEIKTACDQYYEQLTAFAKNKENEQKIKDVLGKSADNFQVTLDQWKKMADNAAFVARSKHEKSSSESTPEERKRAFDMLAVMVDRFQYMQWRLQNLDQGSLDDARLDKACQLLEESRGADCRAFSTICDELAAIKISHNEVSDHPSRGGQSSGTLEIELLQTDVTATASENMVKFLERNPCGTF